MPCAAVGGIGAHLSLDHKARRGDGPFIFLTGWLELIGECPPGPFIDHLAIRSWTAESSPIQHPSTALVTRTLDSR
jgi:hypothetical protein